MINALLAKVIGTQNERELKRLRPIVARVNELESGIKLVSNADSGFNEEHEVTWIPPAEPGPVTLWAVVRDARGGSSVARRFLQVK